MLPPLGEGEAVARRAQRPEGVAQAVLAELGKLDRGDDGGPAWTGRQARPGIRRVVPAPQAAQQVGALDGDPVGRPGSREGRRTDRRRGPDVLPRRAAEVRRHAGRPPRDLAGGFGPASRVERP